MTIISCAQNNEDVILWRALKYIDQEFLLIWELTILSLTPLQNCFMIKA